MNRLPTITSVRPPFRFVDAALTALFEAPPDAPGDAAADAGAAAAPCVVAPAPRLDGPGDDATLDAHPPGPGPADDEGAPR